MALILRSIPLIYTLRKLTDFEKCAHRSVICFSVRRKIYNSIDFRMYSEVYFSQEPESQDLYLCSLPLHQLLLCIFF